MLQTSTGEADGWECLADFFIVDAFFGLCIISVLKVSKNDICT